MNKRHKWSSVIYNNNPPIIVTIIITHLTLLHLCLLLIEQQHWRQNSHPAQRIKETITKLRDGEGSNPLLLRDTVLGAESTTSPNIDLRLRRHLFAIIVGQSLEWMSRRSIGGDDDHEDGSLRSSLDNHKPCRSWEKTPSQSTNREVSVTEYRKRNLS
jgi:hypothetical protein